MRPSPRHLASAAEVAGASCVLSMLASTVDTMLPGGADPDAPCGDDCALHAPKAPLHRTPERSSDAPRSTAPIDPPPLKHVFVTGEFGRVPGLHKEWVRGANGWIGLVVHPVLVEDGWLLEQEWVPAAWIEEA